LSGASARAALISAVAVHFHLGVHGHSRFGCPTPRSSNTGIKSSPCGAQNNDFTGAVQDVQPGPFTVMIEEAINHNGSPWRISLSAESDDNEACPLLDHIPHDPASRPSFGRPDTYHRLFITIEIPDVACDRCSLHLANPMTDKIGAAGAPDAEGCTEPGTCFSNYYSCTTPLRINGSVPRAQYQCPGGMPSDWPRVWTGDGGAVVDASVPGLYRRESASWSGGSGEPHWLLDAPARYRSPAGGMCLSKGGDAGNGTSGSDDTSDSPTKSAILSKLLESRAALAVVGSLACLCVLALSCWCCKGAAAAEAAVADPEIGAELSPRRLAAAIAATYAATVSAKSSGRH